MQTCGRVQMALTETGAQEANIDEVGIGAGVVDRGRELNLPFNGINFGSEPSDKARFFNLRAEAYWNLRTEFERGEIDLEDDEKLKRQLCSIKWHPNSKGQIVIEKKEDMVRRGLKSPDRADGSALASLSNLRRIYTEIQMGDAGMRASPWRNA